MKSLPLAACLLAALLFAAGANAATVNIAAQDSAIDMSELQDWNGAAALDGDLPMAGMDSAGGQIRVGATFGRQARVQPAAPETAQVAKVEVAVAPVPEPATLSMFVIGLGILAFASKSKQQTEKFEA